MGLWGGRKARVTGELGNATVAQQRPPLECAKQHSNGPLTARTGRTTEIDSKTSPSPFYPRTTMISEPGAATESCRINKRVNKQPTYSMHLSGCPEKKIGILGVLVSGANLGFTPPQAKANMSSATAEAHAKTYCTSIEPLMQCPSAYQTIR